MTSKATQAQGSDVVPITDMIALDEVERALMDPTVRLSVPDADPEEASRAIIRSILEADDPLAGLEVTPARELLGVPIMLTDVEWRNSDFAESGPGIFAVMRGRLEDGSDVVVSCGGANVLAQLYRVVKDGRLPDAVAIEEARKPTAKGYRPLFGSPERGSKRVGTRCATRWSPPKERHHFAATLAGPGSVVDRRASRSGAEPGKRLVPGASLSPAGPTA